MEQEQKTENTSPTSISSRGLIALVAFFVAVVIIGGGYAWKNAHPAQSPEVATNDVAEPVVPVTEQPATATPKVETLKIDPIKAQMPSLTRALPAGTDSAIAAKIADAVKSLKNNYDYMQEWLELAGLRKAVGDYAGAAEAWKFATILRPNVSTAYLNLGDLYGYYLHDNAKAEQYLLAGIKSEPKNTYTYYKTYEFYMDIEKDAVKARKVLEDGIAANPTTSQDLKTSLDNL